MVTTDFSCAIRVVAINVTSRTITFFVRSYLPLEICFVWPKPKPSSIKLCVLAHLLVCDK